MGGGAALAGGQTDLLHRRQALAGKSGWVRLRLSCYRGSKLMTLNDAGRFSSESARVSHCGVCIFRRTVRVFFSVFVLRC